MCVSSELRRFRARDVRDLAEEQHGLITTAQLAWAGVPPATCRRWCLEDVLVRLAPRVYLVPELLDDRSHLAAVCLSSPWAVASHRAAALLWGLDGIDADLVEVSVPHGVTLRRGVVHRTNDLADFEVVEREGIRCTDPTRTLLDLGGVIDEDSLERALESALRRRLTSVPRLQWRLGELSRPGRPGPAPLRRVLVRRPRGAPPTESDLETRFLQVLRAAGVLQPVRQHRVKLPDGGSVRLDFAYPDKVLFIETDGYDPHRSRRAFVRDRRRENQVVLLGWKPLRFTWVDVVHRPEQVADEVATALARS